MTFGSVSSDAWALVRWGWRRWTLLAFAAFAFCEGVLLLVDGNWELLVSFVLFTVVSGWVLALVALDVLDHDGSQHGRLARAFAALGPLIVTVSLVSVGADIVISVGFLLLIVPGLILVARWAVLIPVLVWERVGFWDAFDRSNQLVRGHTGKVLLLVLIPLLLLFSLSAGLWAASTAGGFIVAVFIDVFATLLIAAISVALYQQLVAEQGAAEPLHGEEGRAPSDLSL